MTKGNGKQLYSVDEHLY